MTSSKSTQTQAQSYSETPPAEPVPTETTIPPSESPEKEATKITDPPCEGITMHVGAARHCRKCVDHPEGFTHDLHRNEPGR